jgi:hypothetical protein
MNDVAASKQPGSEVIAGIAFAGAAQSAGIDQAMPMAGHSGMWKVERGMAGREERSGLSTRSVFTTGAAYLTTAK